MNFKEFEKEILLYFRETLGDDYTVSINEVRKNNNIILNGLLMKKKNQTITPNIYLNRYYEQYIEGEELEQIKEDIWNTYVEALDSFKEKDLTFEMDLEQQKDKIVYRLVNYQTNKEKLEHFPHIRFLDLAITFHCFVDLSEETLSMIPVSKELAERWKLDTSGLFAYAHKNTPRLFPSKCKTLECMIKDMIGEKQFEEMFQDNYEVMPMYVVTNEPRVNGAAVMLYEEIFNELAKQIGGKIFILPSSIHEVIVMPYDEEIEPEQLELLVSEVNLTQVPWEDVLSNHVYLYDYRTRTFEIL